jgi:hypothetical protein
MSGFSIGGHCKILCSSEKRFSILNGGYTYPLEGAKVDLNYLIINCF